MDRALPYSFTPRCQVTPWTRSSEEGSLNADRIPRGWPDIHLGRHHRPRAGDPDVRGTAFHTIGMAGTGPAMTAREAHDRSASQDEAQGWVGFRPASLRMNVGRIRDMRIRVSVRCSSGR
jgi:hypothetical protein